MEQKRINSMRKVCLFPLLIALLLCISCFVPASFASAASSEGTESNAIPNTLTLSVKAPADFQDTLWITLLDVDKGQEFVVKLDFTIGSNIKFQLGEGKYQVVKANAERQSDRYIVTFDTTEFTIGDGTSPSILLNVQATPDPEPTSEPSSDVSSEPNQEATSEPTSEPTEDVTPEPDSSVEPSESDEPTVPEEPSESPEPSDDGSDDNNNDTDSSSPGILKRVYNAILSISATAVFVCLVVAIVYFVRRRNGEE